MEMPLHPEGPPPRARPRRRPVRCRRDRGRPGLRVAHSAGPVWDRPPVSGRSSRSRPTAATDARAVTVLDLDSRHCPAEAAADAVRGALRLAPTGDTLVLKKIDSLLRGNVAAEVAALAADGPGRGRRPRPAGGRARGARGRGAPRRGAAARGRRLARRGHGPAVLGGRRAGRTAHALIPLATVRRRTAHPVVRAAHRGGRVRIAVCDAETDADLDAIVAASLADDLRLRLVGTGGLAAALGRHLAAGPATTGGDARPETAARAETAGRAETAARRVSAARADTAAQPETPDAAPRTETAARRETAPRAEAAEPTTRTETAGRAETAARADTTARPATANAAPRTGTAARADTAARPTTAETAPGPKPRRPPTRRCWSSSVRRAGRRRAGAPTGRRRRRTRPLDLADLLSEPPAAALPPLTAPARPHPSKRPPSRTVARPPGRQPAAHRTPRCRHPPARPVHGLARAVAVALAARDAAPTSS